MKGENTTIARDLRKNLTETEEILWERLRNRRFLNCKFLRQHPISFYIDEKESFFIADFFCDKKKLIIEIDGDIHLKQKMYDQYRDMILNALGIQVIRVSAWTIKEDIESFLSEILTPLLFPREGQNRSSVYPDGYDRSATEGGWGMSLGLHQFTPTPFLMSEG
jgi:very-short-patch-repair endonuclease